MPTPAPRPRWPPSSNVLHAAPDAPAAGGPHNVRSYGDTIGLLVTLADEPGRPGTTRPKSFI
ncbi:MAG: hypothetical protein DMF98_17715 [Acidobacteria bacterium]|nr:MAG: hypothetical protein DMF98_17715 [Acidobacteriota bacterium]